MYAGYCGTVALGGVCELQLVVEQHFQRHEQMEAGLSDSPDTPSPIAAQQPNGAVAQWAGHSSSETYVSCDEQAGSSEEGGETSETSACRQKSASSPSSVSR
ncbi:protein phosphatase 1 regulatory subunit 1C isoform X2 [Tachysurus ichikawai]